MQEWANIIKNLQAEGCKTSNHSSKQSLWRIRAGYCEHIQEYVRIVRCHMGRIS